MKKRPNGIFFESVPIDNTSIPIVLSSSTFLHLFFFQSFSLSLIPFYIFNLLNNMTIRVDLAMAPLLPWERISKYG